MMNRLANVPTWLLMLVIVYSESRQEIIRKCPWLIPGLPSILAIFPTLLSPPLLLLGYLLSKTSIFK